MIQDMALGYATDILVGYVKGGIIGWAVWFVLAIAYTLLSYRLDMSLYRTEEKGPKKKLTMRGLLIIAIWPVGMMIMSHELVKDINATLNGRSK